MMEKRSVPQNVPDAIKRQRAYVNSVWNVERSCPYCKTLHNPHKEADNGARDITCECGCVLVPQIALFGGYISWGVKSYPHERSLS